MDGAENVGTGSIGEIYFEILRSRLAGWDDDWTKDQKAAAFKAWLAAQAAVGTPVAILYELASPAEISGTPQTIRTHYPYTQITNDAGAEMEAENNYLWDVGVGASSISADSADTVITGVQIQGNDTDKTVYKAGTDDFAVRITDNSLAQDGLQDLVNALGTQLIGTRFPAYSVSAPMNPAVETGDIVWLTDKQGVQHTVPVSGTQIEFGDYEQFRGDAESEDENQSERFDKADKAQESADDAQDSADQAQQGVDEAKAEISTLNGQIVLKADKGTLISEINVCPESIKISSGRIDITGLVTISSLENGSTEIDGACIRTGRIESQDGDWWLDLEDGTFYLKNGTFAGVIDWGAGEIRNTDGTTVISASSIDIRPDGSGPTYIKNPDIQSNLRYNGDTPKQGNWNIQMADGSSHRFYFEDGLLVDTD